MIAIHGLILPLNNLFYHKVLQHLNTTFKLILFTKNLGLLIDVKITICIYGRRENTPARNIKKCSLKTKELVCYSKYHLEENQYGN